MPKANHRVDLTDGFVVKSITFTENELYIIVIGEL